MPRVIVCPQGHRWDADTNDTGTWNGPLVCPVCGATPASNTTVSALNDEDPQDTGAYRNDSSRHRPRELEGLSVSRRVSIPGYEILSTLGRGGMGIVYKARQVKLKRLVALKMILAGAQADPQELERFRTEAEAVARLQHPNIVQIHEVGEHDGQPYLSLEFVDGDSLHQKLNGTPLVPREAAQLVETLARAMQVAHERGIVHRDLKPANVLMTREGTPKISDFGLAKRIDDDSGQTRSGAVVGTPSYMAPEQATGQTRDVGPLADVYALGAILYETLTGRPPFRAATFLDTLEQVRRQEPVPPSRLQPKLPRDLETVCMKCLQKDPAKRYDAAGKLAEDLRRFVDGLPVLARPIGPLARGWRWCRRNPRVALLSTSLLTALLVGSVLSTLFGIIAIQQANRADEKANDALEKAEQLKREKQFSDLRLYGSDTLLAFQAWDSDNAMRAVDLLRAHVHRPDQEDLRGFEWYHLWRRCHGDRLTMSHGRARSVEGVGFSVDGKTLAAGDNEGTVVLWDPATGRPKTATRLQPKQLFDRAGIRFQHTLTAFSADLGTGASTGWKQGPAGAYNGIIKVFDLRSGEERLTLDGHSFNIRSLALNGDGSVLVSVAGSSYDKPAEIKLWDLVSGQERHTFKGHKGRGAAALSPDGKRVVTGGDEGSVRSWDAGSGSEQTVQKLAVGAIKSFAFSADGQTLAVAGEGTIVLLGPVSGQQREFPRHEDPGYMRIMAFSPDGKTLASAGENRSSVALWDINAMRKRSSLRGHQSDVRCLAFALDGKALATGSSATPAVSGQVKLWDPAMEPVPARWDDWRTTGQVQGSRPTSSGMYTSVAFAPDGGTLITGNHHGFLKFWDPATGQERVVVSKTQAGAIASLACSPDSTLAATASRSGIAGRPGEIRLWDVATGGEVATLTTNVGVSRAAVAFSPDGKTLASADAESFNNGLVRLWDIATRKERAVFRPLPDVRCLAFGSDDSTLAVGGTVDEEGGVVKLLDLRTGEERATLRARMGTVEVLAFSPDGKRLATGSYDGIVKLWDLTTGREPATLVSEKNGIRGLAFTHDGRTLATAGGMGIIRLWLVESGQELGSLGSPSDLSSGLAFSPDAKMLVAGGSLGLNVWRAASAEEVLARLTSHSEEMAPLPSVTKLVP